jgi:NADPH:quinone reductase-like Zn-dependent oxidoreductase
MKAIVQNGYGSADVLALREVDDPVVGDDDVLVRVHAAGCGPDVWHLMTGLPYFVRAMPGFRTVHTRVPGQDFAGRVEAVGSNVADVPVGEDVMGVAHGSFAELALARPEKLARKPAGITFEQAAAVPISGCSALQSVRHLGGAGPGQTAAIVGAGGGVGTFAVQIAKALGAGVTGVCSAAKADVVRSIGADDVIDYTREDFADGGRRWDLVVETAGRRPISELRRALTPTGTLVIVGGEGGNRWTGGFGRQLFRAPFASMLTRQRLRSLNAKEGREDLETLASMIDAGRVTPVVGSTYPLAAAADALRELEGGHATGKIVVTVGEGPGR